MEFTSLSMMDEDSSTPLVVPLLRALGTAILP